MDPKHLLAAVLYLFLLALTGYAQPQPNRAQMQNSPVMQQGMKNGLKAQFRMIWDGRGGNLMAFGMLRDPEFRAALDVSDEQHQRIEDAMGAIGTELQKNPEYQKLIEEGEALRNPDDPLMLNADEETLKKISDLQQKLQSFGTNYMIDTMNNNLTAEQKQKLKELLLANMGEMPFVSPSMFDALDLSTAQKQQMEKIKKDFEPEFEKNLENFANGTVMMLGKAFEESAKQGNEDKSMDEIQKKLLEDPEYKKINDEIMSQGKAFATQFKTKMFDVLTDDQWVRLQKLIDNPPAHAKAYAKQLKEQMGEAEKSGQWMPGPNSWKPGDPIPEQYRQQREERIRTRQRQGVPRTESE
jgi:Ni/Co efflux regulator RcnB